MRRYLFMLGIICLIVSITGTTHACSGAANYLQLDHLGRYDLIVDATVVDVDSSGWNGVLKVHRYFKGDGQHFLPVSNEFWGRYNARNLRRYDTGCYFPIAYWQLGERAYIGLRSNTNGTYSDGPAISGARFPVENDLVTYYDYPSEAFASISTQEFESILLDYSDHDEPIESTFDTRYPLMRELRVISESGMAALIQVDHDIRRLDPRLDAFNTSPDGTHTVFRINGNDLYFITVGRRISEETSYEWGERIHGQNVGFSPNSSLVAVWDDAELMLYRFDNTGNSDRGLSAMQLFSVGQTAFANVQVAQDRDIVWSGNSSTVAYLDGDGIWAWNIYHDDSPQLIVSYAELDDAFDDGEITLFELSFTGSYIRYVTAYYWHLLDINDDTIIPNALVTPDESRFAQFTPDIDSVNSCEIPIDLSCPINIQQSGELRLYYLRQSDLVVVTCDVTCVSHSYPTDVSQMGGFYGQGWNTPLSTSAVYDNEFDTIAWQLDEYRVQIDYYSRISSIETWQPLYFDFSEILDSPIQSIQWDQPFFFNGD